MATNAQKEIRKALVDIDAAITLLANVVDGYAAKINVNPFSILIEISKSIGVYDALVNWLSNFIIVTLPIIEVGVKGLLLSYLKDMITCAADPTIPQWMRDVGVPIDTNVLDWRGILQTSPFEDINHTKYYGVNLKYKVEYYAKGVKEPKTLDEVYDTYKEAKDVCKELKKGDGIDKVKVISYNDTVYTLARANDFNAFLWFVMNKAFFVNALNFERAINDYYVDNGDIKSIFMPHKYFFKDNDKILNPGTTFKTINANTFAVLLCNEKVDDKIQSTIVPVSSNYKGANWYVNNAASSFLRYSKGDYVKNDKIINATQDAMNHVFGSNEERDYVGEKPLCNISYPKVFDTNDTVDNAIYNVYDNIVIRILPKPTKRNGKKILFDGNGMISKNGALSCNVGNKVEIDRGVFKDSENALEVAFVVNAIKTKHNEYLNQNNDAIKEAKIMHKNGEDIYNFIYNNIDYGVDFLSPIGLEKFNNGTYDYNGLYYYPIIGGIFGGKQYVVCKSKVNGDEKWCIGYIDNNNVIATDALPQELIDTCLFECYNGWSVYEFNYDFVTSMKLFDAKVVAAQIIESLLGVQITVSLSYNHVESDWEARVSEFVKEIVEKETSNVSDCFFSFDDSRIEEELKNAEIKKHDLYTIDGSRKELIHVNTEQIDDILAEYNEDGNLNENIDTLTSAFNQITATIKEESLPLGENGFQLDIVTKLIELLVDVIVKSLMSPKVMVLFEMNRKLMGQNATALDPISFLMQIKGLIYKIVSELKLMLLTELFTFILNHLKTLVEQLVELYAKEYSEFYRDLIRDLLEKCSISFNGRSNIPSTLDRVNYADIDEPQSPQNKEC